MTLNETLKQLKALGNAKVRAQNAKTGAGYNQYGVSLGGFIVGAALRGRPLSEKKSSREIAC